METLWVRLPVVKTRHILLTNDFPPKRGGIQNYHYELWSRLDPESFSVICPFSADRDRDRDFDEKAKFKVTRVKGPLLPTASLRQLVERETAEMDAAFVVIEPALPLGLIGGRLSLPYVVVAFGAEFVIPAGVPLLRNQLAKTIDGAALIVAGGGYPASEVISFMATFGKDVKDKVAVVRPGVDLSYFRPPDPAERADAREYFGIQSEEKVVVFVSRLVPRKGADTVLKAVSLIEAKERPRVFLGGAGREARRLQSLSRSHSVDATFLGGLSKGELRKLYWAGDVFAMATRSRWMGLEQEGFGIVFLEAAATGLPVVVGRSGGSYETLLTGRSGFLVDPPNSPALVKTAIESILGDEKLKRSFGSVGRAFVSERFDYDLLSEELKNALDSVLIG